MVKRNDFTFHAKEWNDCISSMTDEELGILCRRMTEYALGSDSDEKISDVAVSFSWKLIKSRMENDFEHEEKTTSNKKKAARASAKVRSNKSTGDSDSDEGQNDSDISEDDSFDFDSSDSVFEIAKEDFAITKDDSANAKESKLDSAHARISRKKSACTEISKKNSAHAENNLQNSVNAEDSSMDSVQAEDVEIVTVNADFTDIQAVDTDFSTDNSVSCSDSLISQTDNNIYNNLNYLTDCQSNISSKSLNTNVNVNLNVAIGVPTLQEVQDYCKSQNLIINPEKFYEYYSDRQWTTGGIPIHNWQRLIMSWNANEWIPSVDIDVTNKRKIPPRCAKAHNFTERDYDFDMLQNKLLAIG